MADEKLIVTLVAEAGRQWEEKKEAIGTYQRSIVFLPRGVQPGEKIQIALEEVRPDARGRMMYRGSPTPIQRVERWIERGAKLERVELAVDWKFQETELGVLESHAILRRDGIPRMEESLAVDFGQTRADLRVRVTTKTLIPEIEDRLVSGHATPVEQVAAWRDVGTIVQTFAVEAIEPIRSGYSEQNDWLARRLRAAYVGEPNLHIRFKLVYAGSRSMETSARFIDLPIWVQDHLCALHPLCGCGRERMDPVSGQPQTCSLCEKEQGFEASLPMERRRELAAQAAKLAAVEPVSGEVGEIILKTFFDHVRDTYRRDAIIKKCAGYAWYYFDGDGVYGAKFSRPALQVLAHLASASGQGLLELAGWIAGSHRPDEYGRTGYEQSYYVRTQLKGEAVAEPVFASGELSSMVVAVKLCGSMADRQAVVEGIERAKKVFDEQALEVVEIDRILQSEEQDYTAALVKIREIETILERQKRGEVLVNFGGPFRRMGATNNADLWVIRPDGSRREPDRKDGRKRYEDSEGSKYWGIVEAGELAISWSKAYTAADHEFIVNKLPLGGLTSSQRVTVGAIEEEILAGYQGQSGKESPEIGCGWGFDSTPVKRRITLREQKIQVALRGSRIILPAESLDTLRASTGEAVWVPEQNLRVSVGVCSFPTSREPDVWFDHDRDRGWVIETLPAGDGMVEVLTVQRGRNDRPSIHFRWRRGRVGDPTTGSTPTKTRVQDRRETNPEPAGQPVDLSKVDLSGLFGGGAKVRR